MFGVSPRLVALNVLLLGVAALFVYQLIGEISAPRSLPVRPAARAPQAPAASAPVVSDTAARPDARGQFGIVASKNLFSPTRTDVVAVEPAGQPAAPRPILHGVVVDEAKSRAYLEDPTTKRVFSYAIGDNVGGGKLETIRADRVGIARPDGVIEVMLRDPSKPRPTPPTQPPAAGQLPGVGPLPSGGQPGSVPPAFPPIRPGVPGAAVPGMPAIAAPTPLPAPVPQPITAPPRPLQSIPSDFLRRPTVPPPDTGTPR